MTQKVGLTFEDMDKPSRYTREVLIEQLLWIIRLRWIAVAGVVATSLVARHVFLILTNATPIYICAGVLLLSNIFYYLAAIKQADGSGRRVLVLGVVQVEVDLVILTAILHFSGGVVNPFFLFYLFHVIVAAIILSRNLSYCVGLTAILLFGLLAVNELNGGLWLGYYPLRFPIAGGIWRDPVYALGMFASFSCTVVLAQYLTRIIILRMTAKELEAARHNDVLKAVIGAMSEGLIFITCDGDIAVCNPAVRLWKNKYVKTDVDSLEDFPSILTNHIKNLLNNNDKTTEAERTIEFHADGPESRYIEARSCSVTGIDGEQLGYVIVGKDLTKHKNLENSLRNQTEQIAAINEMLKMTRVQMAQREKMVAIGQMAAGIAHEIGNPLASLSSVVQYLSRKLRTHENKEQLLLIGYQVDRISGILKRMVSLSRPATSEYEWTDINQLIDNTLALVKFDKRMQSIEIKNVTNSDLPMVWLNPQLFEQVLLNIFINAIDAMNVAQGQRESVLEITRKSIDKMVEIQICDTGIGMNPQVAKRAFESFFTTKEIGKGTGLGLFISYNLVTEIGGTIKLESELDKGTTVIIRIPLRPQKDLITAENNQIDSAI